MKILLIEDNLNLAKSIVRVLKHEGFSVAQFTKGAEAETYWKNNHKTIDLVVLDWMLPERTGLEICQSIRKAEITTLTIMLTARGALEDKVSGLQNGADDYLVKPFQFEELMARIHALLRRPRQYEKQNIQLNNNIIFDAKAHKVTKNKNEVILTPKEFEILEFLVRNKNKAVSQQSIFDHCFDFAKDNWSNTIEVHIKNLRKKLFNTDEDAILKTIRGLGYRLEV